ncbi:insulinase family protein [Plectonema cf. radiosum LEGE 06105]|uniref:Insulinase family protein n=1 Tax=Plectonema cf. radiosum LEGE 06105 TaxID=945769 RepID=A0A8J7EZP3_9CYAN|nr:pitrilysin family protein [Plectonema radiosum]MBE9211695.1 insulinase family protein [Plectonema cf. radiosum LEGE 06105]
MTTLPKKLNLHRTVLKNGIILLVSENSAADIIAARIFIRAGSCDEKPEKAGLANLLSAVLTKGCDGLSNLEIAQRVESVGASLSADTTTDYFVLSLKTVTADFTHILELATRILRSPTFPAESVEMEKRIALQDIRLQKEQPFNVAFEQLRQIMYKNHPYASSGLGDETTISSLTREDLVKFYSDYFRPDNIVISIAGRISPEDATKQVEELFGDWQTLDTPPPVIDVPFPQTKPQQIITPQATQQSIIMLGYLGASVQEADYPALKLLSTYLGNGLSSRLFIELREKLGLAYDVSALYPTRKFSSSFVVYMGTAPENTTTALAGLRREVDLLSSSKLAESALQTAKNKILGQYALGKQTNGQIAQIYGWYEILGLGIAFDQKFQQDITALTPVETINAASKYLKEPFVSVIGQKEAINRVIA